MTGRWPPAGTKKPSTFDRRAGEFKAVELSHFRAFEIIKNDREGVPPRFEDFE